MFYGGLAEPEGSDDGSPEPEPDHRTPPPMSQWSGPVLQSLIEDPLLSLLPPPSPPAPPPPGIFPIEECLSRLIGRSSENLDHVCQFSRFQAMAQ